MQVLEVGDGVVQLRFFPDGRRLLVGTATDKGVVQFDILSLSGGQRLRLPLPLLDVNSWHSTGHGNAAAVHPSGEWCYVAWGSRLFSFWTKDGSARPTPAGIRANHAFLSPRGDRLVASQGINLGQPQLSTMTVGTAGDAVLWAKVPTQSCRQLAGFLPDGERFVTLDDTVSIRAFATGEDRAVCRYKSAGWAHPQVSPDGRHLGLVGYGSMYVYDLDTLAKPRRISSGSNFGNFVGFAFHPDGRTLAVIHGGPTLVKLYDVETLKLTAKFNWKLGPLGCVAFSPDGMLGAAGSPDGRIVVWDVDP